MSHIGNTQKMQNGETQAEKAATHAAGESIAARQPATQVIVDKSTSKVVKVVSQHLEPPHPAAELLGD